MGWTQVDDFAYPQGWSGDATERSRECCAALEEGKVVYFSRIPFNFPEEDRQFLLSQKQSGFRHHKNVSYRPTQDFLRGASNDDPADTAKLQDLMRRYSREVVSFMGKFLLPYADRWKLDYASFRPLEEAGRDLPLHKRNDLAHVDAFPSRPTHGGRILRVFTNINPTQPRVWEVAGSFEEVAGKLAPEAGLSKYAKQATSPLRPALRAAGPLLTKVGLPDRSPYDSFMLRFHDFLKENTQFQTGWPKQRLEFPPFSTWLVYTDSVPHAVMSGQFALEQTFIIPISAMVTPARSPMRVLESLAGCSLA